jgi:translation initiation factor IF-2
MTINNTEVTNENQVHLGVPQTHSFAFGGPLLDELQTLLEKQMELARQGNIREVEVLSKKAGSLVEKIIQTGTPDRPETLLTGQQRRQLGKLYEDLCLAISAQKAGVCTELKQVRKGKKTIQAYRSHI